MLNYYYWNCVAPSRPGCEKQLSKSECATASHMQRFARTNSIKKVGFETGNLVHFVFLRLKKTPAFGWHDEFRGGYLSLFNKMPRFVGLSTIAHG